MEKVNVTETLYETNISDALGQPVCFKKSKKVDGDDWNKYPKFINIIIPCLHHFGDLKAKIKTNQKGFHIKPSGVYGVEIDYLCESKHPEDMLNMFFEPMKILSVEFLKLSDNFSVKVNVTADTNIIINAGDFVECDTINQTITVNNVLETKL